MIGTITLNPSIDQNCVVKGLVKHDANRALEIIRTPGGKGINVSKVVRELGGKTHAYALAGGLPGDLLKELARKIGVPLSVVAINGDTRMNTVITDLKDQSQTRVSAPGPVMKKNDVRKFKRLLLSVKPKPFLWALGGSLPQGMNPRTYRDLILFLEKNGTPCVLDTDDEALKFGIEATPFMIKPNEFEMCRLVGKRMHDLREYKEAAGVLIRKGIQVAIVSLAARGALFVTAKEAFHVSTPKVPVKSHVGAGDSLIGGVCLGLLRKMPLKDAARLGVAASTSAVMREAPRLCLRSDIPKLLPKIKIREI